MEKKEYYSQILKDPRWQKKRLEIMQRDDFACQHCGSKEKTLHIHHRRYVNGLKPWEYDNSDYITLCEDCHRFETENNGELYRQFTELKEAFIVRGFSMELFSNILLYLDSALSFPDEKKQNDPAVSLIEYSIMSSQNISDAFAAKRLGYDGRAIIEEFHPELLNLYDTIKEE